MAVIGSLVHYLLIFVVLVTVAGLGIFAGKRLSDREIEKMEANGENEEVK